jgi:NAD+ synthase (glutamine-hydrolysing)
MTIRIVVVQHDFPVGDIDGNMRRILTAIERAKTQHRADLVLFPELALTGYPPEDLLYRGGFQSRCERALELIVAAVSGVDVILGHPLRQAGLRYNAVSWIRDHQVIGTYCKQALPNYSVFDEERYFQPGKQALTIECAGVKVGVLICEDIWEQHPAQMAAADGCELIVVPNASPYHIGKRELREKALLQRTRETGCPVVYANVIGGQDELVFDGRSFAITEKGEITGPTPAYSDDLFTFEWQPGSGFSAVDWQAKEIDRSLGLVYQTLLRGTGDYIRKNGFERVIIGLSGGIDSALTLAIAVDALGAENVRAVMMPSRHTSQLSLDLACEQAELLGVHYDSISIEPAYEAFLASLNDAFEGKSADVTEENLQARCRGNILMALSNKHGAMVLTTGNKSEIAVGYCTIYGDMCGGFAPIKDCVKTLVYKLCNYRNQSSTAIPQGVIDRPPSAELAPGQLDQDSLPAYEILDEILARYVERDQSVKEIVAAGFDQETVIHIANLVRINEYKRRQAAPGVRVTPRAFGRDRRYPITNGWRDKV